MGNMLAKTSISCFFALFFMGVSITVNQHAEDTLSMLRFGFTEAEARMNRGEVRRVARINRGEVHRVARRTARRVNRRHSYYRTLPANCTKVFFNGMLHHYCGGIYYRPQMDRNETTYVIVNP